MKNNIKILQVIVCVLVCLNISYGQSFNYVNQLNATDYTATVEFSANTSDDCVCYDDDSFTFRDLNQTDALAGFSYPHQDPQIQTVIVPKLVGFNGNVQCKMQIIGGPFESTCFGCGSTIFYDFPVITDLPYAPSNISINYLVDGEVQLSWTNITDIPESEYEVRIYKNGNLHSTSAGGSTTWTDSDCSPPGTIFQLSTHYIPEFNSSVNGNLSSDIIVPDVPNPPPSGWGYVEGNIYTLTGAAVNGVIVRATLQNPDDFGGCLPLITESTPSQANGYYKINDIVYAPDGPDAIYEVEAILTGHQFRTTADASSTESTYTFTVNSSTNKFSNNSFYDITSYSITGKVTSANTNIGLDSVLILEVLGGNSGIIPIYTASDGTYSLIVPSGNATYNIRAKYRSGAIQDSTMVVQVINSDVNNIDFVHTATQTLSGYVGAGCGEFIGNAEVKVYTPDDILLASITTDDSGNYSAVLPARPLKVEVDGITLSTYSGLSDVGAVLAGFGGPVTTQFEEDTTLDFVYRKPLSVEISGLPPFSCAAIPYPIVEQGRDYVITLQVREGDFCPVDTGKIIIYNDISGSGNQSQIIDSVTISQGVAYYSLTPGDPKFTGDYTKNITFQTVVGEETNLVTQKAIVTGAVQSGNSFTTAAPTELPFVILRDPPGDGSYSSFTEENVTTLSQQYFTQNSGGVKVWANVKAGTDIFGLSIWGQIGGSFEVNSSSSTTEEFILEISNATTFTTSDGENNIGDEGDVFVGAAVNFIYAKAKTLEFDISACEINEDKKLLLNSNGFESTFIYTQSAIRETIIPTRQAIADDPSLPDSVRYRAQNDVGLWEQVLQLNEDLKEDALEANTQSLSISSGASAEYTQSTSKTSSKTLEFTTQIDIGVAAEVGLEFMNNGFSAGVDVNFQTSFGEVKTTSANTTTTTSYFLSDDDDNAGSADFLLLDVGEDPVYGTPVFKVQAGDTQCPYEENTMAYDDMTLTIPSPVLQIPAGQNNGFMTFEISNNHPSATRSYNLQLIQSTNAGGLTVKAGGSAFGGSPHPIENVNPGSTVNLLIEFVKPPNLPQFDFEGIEFYLIPSCFDTYKDANIYSQASLSVFFENSCSEIEMASPIDDWTIIENNNNFLPVTMTGYDLNSNFDNVILQYQEVGANGWSTSNINLQKSELMTGSTTVNWDVSDIAEGQYNVRFRLSCAGTYSYSSRVVGTIDRKPPRVYGLEKPSNDRYFQGDEISAQFSEPLISPTDISNYYLMKIPQEEMVPAQATYENDKVSITPIADISEDYNQAYQAGLVNLEDLMGNTRTDTVKWEFVVGEPDSDDDGVTTLGDRCPGGNDYIDTDADGLPDDCDCLPEVPVNGRLLTKSVIAFDGVDDYISLENPTASLTPSSTQAVTYEAWIYADTIISSSFIASAYTEFGGDNDFEIRAVKQGASNYYISVPIGGFQIFWSGANLQLKQWHHIAVVLAEGTSKVYVDGDPYFPYNMNYPANPYGNTVEIGNATAYPFDDVHPWQGKMDEFRVWAGERTAAEIQANMSVELTGQEPNLLSYHPMDDGTPKGMNTDLLTTVDATGNGNVGILHGFEKMGDSSNWVDDDKSDATEEMEVLDICLACADTINTMLNFDGTDDHLVISHDADFDLSTSQSFTFEGWINVTDSNSINMVLSKGNGSNATTSYIFGILDDKIALQLSDGSTTKWHYGSSGIRYGSWMHIAVTYDHTNDNVIFYRDGVVDGKSTYTGSFYNSNSPVYIGRQGEICDCNYFRGSMDDIRIWNVARTSLEIRNSLDKEIIPTSTGLVAAYGFNTGIAYADNTGITNISDLTGNGHDGVITNFNQTGFLSNWSESPIGFPDVDLDGLPDLCDDCEAYPTVILDNQALNGTYRAEEVIEIGSGITIPNNANVILRAPNLKVADILDIPLSSSVIIEAEPCEND